MRLNARAEATTESTEDALRRISGELVEMTERAEQAQARADQKLQMWLELVQRLDKSIEEVHGLLDDVVTDRSVAGIQQFALQLSNIAGVRGLMQQIQDKYQR